MSRSLFQRSLTLFSLMALLGGIALVGRAQSQVTPAQGPLPTLLGKDDNAAIVIHYGGETRGNIDTCG